MRYNVTITNTLIYGYEVEASSKEEAKVKANEIFQSDNFGTPVSDWYCEVEEDLPEKLFVQASKIENHETS